MILDHVPSRPNDDKDFVVDDNGNKNFSTKYYSRVIDNINIMALLLTKIKEAIFRSLLAFRGKR